MKRIDGITANELRWHCVSHWLDWLMWHYENRRFEDMAENTACVSCQYCKICDELLMHGAAPMFTILNSVPGGYSPDMDRRIKEERFTSKARNRK